MTNQTLINEPLKLNAYYYSFEATGVRPIDVILSAVARAGKAFHHTEQWGDDCQWPPLRGNSPVEWIQNAANDAANALSRPTEGCLWTDDEDGPWHTACGHEFEFINDGPRENGMRFCCYCGKPLTEQPSGNSGEFNASKTANGSTE